MRQTPTTHHHNHEPGKHHANRNSCWLWIKSQLFVLLLVHILLPSAFAHPLKLRHHEHDQEFRMCGGGLTNHVYKLCNGCFTQGWQCCSFGRSLHGLTMFTHFGIDLGTGYAMFGQHELFYSMKTKTVLLILVTLGSLNCFY